MAKGRQKLSFVHFSLASMDALQKYSESQSTERPQRQDDDFTITDSSYQLFLLAVMNYQQSAAEASFIRSQNPGNNDSVESESEYLMNYEYLLALKYLAHSALLDSNDCKDVFAYFLGQVKKNGPQNLFGFNFRCQKNLQDRLQELLDQSKGQFSLSSLSLLPSKRYINFKTNNKVQKSYLCDKTVNEW